MLKNTLFMVRNGSFGIDFNQKLFITIIGLFVCFYYWKTNKNKDYLWVYLIGSFIWFLIELGAQMQGIRIMNTSYLFGFQIPVVIASLLRGTSEGGFVALLGLFIADKLMNKKEIKTGLVILVVVMAILLLNTINQGLPFKNIGGIVASRRNLFTPVSLIFMSIASIFNIIWIMKVSYKVRQRVLGMFLVMILITGFWTFVEYLVNTRWIEIETVGLLSKASLFLQIIGLFYDVVIEIGLCYILFLAIPCIFGLIKEKK